jgi:hypothetical protein
MVQQAAARAEAPPAADPASAGKAEGLGRDWLILRDCRLGPSDRGVLPSVLIHPGRGVAVLDILPAKTPDAVGAVRGRLAAARLPAIFAGHLPVVHLQATPRQMPFLPSLLDDAFAAEPPLRLPGGDAWVGVAARALTAEQPVPRLASQRFRSGRRRRRAAGLRTAGAVLLCLAALGGVLALVLRGAPAPEAGSVPTAPVAAATPAVGEAVPQEAAPSAPSPVPEPVLSPPEPPSRSGPGTAAPLPQEPASAPPSPPIEMPLTAPQRAAAAPPRRPEAGAAAPPPPPARKPPERVVPRKQQETAGTASPSTGGNAAASPEAVPQRCSRITALVGLGAPLGDGDMRFFNETCIRW